ncbi:hypothetical protein ACFL6X_03040 [Candidatus Latescibacterota bacterium]
MTKIGRILALAVLPGLLLWSAEGYAGEAFVTKVRGTTLTIDKGAEDELEVGMTVTVVRPPEEAVIHPLTGENLGSPEIDLGSAEIHRVSARAASVRMTESPLLGVRPGDVVRFVTLEEKMMEEQEQSTRTTEQATQDRQQIRGEASRLARNIKSIQSTIRSLEATINDIRRFNKDVVQPQFRSINQDVEAIKGDLEQLKITVSLIQASAPVGEPGEAGAELLTKEEAEELRQLIDAEVAKLQAQVDRMGQPPAPDEEMDTGMPPEMTEGMEPESASFFTSPLFFGLLGMVGVGGVGFWFWTRMGAGGDEDDEEEEEDDEMELDEDEEDDDVEVEIDEEEMDDIVVEET